jgi:hypothetical protein
LRNNNFQVPENKVVRKLFVPRKNELYGECSFVTYALHPVWLHSKMKVSTYDSLNGQNKHCLQNSYDESLLESHQLKKKHTCKYDTNISKTDSKNKTVARQGIMDSHWYSSVKPSKCAILLHRSLKKPMIQIGRRYCTTFSQRLGYP